MNKQIKNGRSRIIALTASISFWGVTGFVMAQTAEKNTQNLTHNTEVNITRLTNQTETQSIDSKTAAETSPSSISSESIIQGKPQRYDDRGCWTMVCIGDSAYRTYKYDKPVLHYKFYGKKSTLTICAYDRRILISSSLPALQEPIRKSPTAKYWKPEKYASENGLMPISSKTRGKTLTTFQA